MPITFYVADEPELSFTCSNFHGQSLLEYLGYQIGGDNGLDPWVGRLDPSDVIVRALSTRTRPRDVPDTPSREYLDRRTADLTKLAWKARNRASMLVYA